MSTTPMKIALFQCRWCLYSPEDQAWVDNDLPENIHLVKVPCTGRIDPLFILNAVQGGADGVMISGCLPEKCHFKEGNLAARRQLAEFSQFLDYIGYAQDRVRFVWLDLQDRGRIQRELAAFESALEQLGPAQTLATRAPAATGGTHD
ncbi:MAG TPA: hydrogenase iron-sulfur subunit [Anaerolineaceae bacterium]|nr:hydrogenase iron-sulfur subunit [Anaerolineaceae bacterium]HOR79233.1 hydrogenase iron-sulfur subunit [Anaerolineaceae bacterium]